MQGKDTIKSTFDQLFEPIFSQSFRQLLQKLEVDKYVKKLTAFKFIILMVFAQLEQLTCLREISNSLNNNKFSKMIKLDSISLFPDFPKTKKLDAGNGRVSFLGFRTTGRHADGFQTHKTRTGSLY